MKPETRKYLKKRESIINTITNTEFVYDRFDVCDKINPSVWEARDLAEKILSKMGNNKPDEVMLYESSGSKINHKYKPNK